MKRKVEKKNKANAPRNLPIIRSYHLADFTFRNSDPQADLFALEFAWSDPIDDRVFDEYHFRQYPVKSWHHHQTFSGSKRSDDG
jgi:hypothetical protein